MRGVFVGAIAGLALLGAMACGSDTTEPGPKGSVVWKIDAQTCRGVAPIDLFVDGGLVGTELIAAGGTSNAYPVSAGSHVIGASVADGAGLVWPSVTHNISAGGTFNAVLTC